MLRRIFKELISWLAFSSVVLSATAAFGQRTRQPRAAAKPAAVTSKKAFCQGGWTGVVTITKTLKESHESDEPGIRKAMDRIKHRTSRDYSYVGRAIVDGTDPQNPVVNAKVTFSDKDLKWGEERVFDTCNSRENGHWFIIEGDDNRHSEARAEGPARSFGLYVDENAGRYSLNLKLPDAIGEYNRVQKVRRSGHCQAKNNEPYDKTDKEPLKVEGESMSVTEQLDPDRPDQISGSKTWGDDGKGKVRTFVYIATWRFTRCPEKLLVTDLWFEHPRYPNPDDWQRIVEQTGTIDGNRVKVKARVVNLSAEAKFAEAAFKETYKGDHWNGSMPDRPLNDNTVSLRLDPGEEREVEIPWNSSGYAWFDDGRPRLVQRIKAEAWENFKLRDEMTKNLKVSPKPLVLVAGLWSDANTFSSWQNYLTTAHSYGWKAIIFDDNITGAGAKANGMPRSVYDYADALEAKVRNAQVELNAWHIDMAGHGNGGLIARLFVHKFGRYSEYDDPRVKHLMMMGTPNLGIACTGTLESEFSNSPEKLFSARELFLEEVQRFNQFVVNRSATKFSALVGRSIGMLCAPLIRGDGIVEIESASAGVEEITYAGSRHADLTEAKYFGNYVRPRVVTGPRGTYPIPVVSE